MFNSVPRPVYILALTIFIPAWIAAARARVPEVNNLQSRKAEVADGKLNAAEKASAEADRLRTDWSLKSFLQAISKYEKARIYWRASKNQAAEAITLNKIGDVYSILSQNKKALDYYNQALPLSRGAGDRRLESEVLSNIGGINIELDEWQAGLDYCNQALALSREIGHVRGEARALNNIGLAYHLLSDFEKALDFFGEALKLWEASGDLQGRAQTLANLGYSHADLGNLEKSFDFLNKALLLWQETKHRRGEALTLTLIALLNSSLGEMQKALDSHTRAIQILQRVGDQAGEAAALNGLAYVHDILGNKHKALDLYKRALQLYLAAGRRSSEAITMGLIGEVYDSLGEKQEALDYYDRKLKITRALKDRRAEAYTLKGMGAVFSSLGEKQKALDHFHQALSLSKSSSDLRAQAYTLNNIGFVKEEIGQKQSALDCYEQALALNRATEDRSGEITTLHNLARVTRDLGNFKAAHERASTLLRGVETLRTKVAGQELRASYFASLHQHYELCIDILMCLHREDPTAGHDASALAVSEKARGRVMLDLLNEAHAEVRQGADPDLLKQERSLQQLLNAKAERQIRLLAGEASAEQLQAIKKEIADITAQHEEVMAQIKSTSPRYAALTQPPTLTLSEIQKQVLDSDTMLLEYSLGEKRSYLWAVTSTSIKTFELPGRGKIEGIASSVYKDLYTPGRSGGDASSRREARPDKLGVRYSEASAQLARILLEPIASELQSKRLVIVADGALQYIPFAALPDPTEGQQPLMLKHEILALPSVSVLAILRKEIDGREPAPKTLAVFADPVFEKDDPRLGRGHGQKGGRGVGAQAHLTRAIELPELDGGSGRRLRFQRLPSAWKEARAIAESVPEEDRKLLLNFDASLPSALSGDLRLYKILHFATHGLLYGVHPQLYGMVLSLVDRQGNQQDGFLRLNHILNLKLSAELVVLSACQTGLGKDVKGEGLVGITRGFMYAGAARVIASLWNVDDKASAEFMKHFYKALMSHSRLQPAAALRAAQIEMWKQPRWRSPYYWAAFTLQGEWKEAAAK